MRPGNRRWLLVRADLRRIVHLQLGRHWLALERETGERGASPSRPAEGCYATGSMSSGRFRPPPEASDDEGLCRYWVRFGKQEVPIDVGETLIGRGEGCHVVVNEALVSRKHARIVLSGGRPYIEDLGSANGTFVNQARLHGRALLFPGDHIFIGTGEIEVVRRADEDRPTLPLMEPGSDRLTPTSGVVTFEPASSSRSTAPRGASSGADAARSEATTEVGAFEYVGRLADKMFTMGRVDAATKILERPPAAMRSS